jgi:hypothetical protein
MTSSNLSICTSHIMSMFLFRGLIQKQVVWLIVTTYVNHSQELNAIFITEVALARSSGIAVCWSLCTVLFSRFQLLFYLVACDFSPSRWKVGRGRVGKSRSQGPCGDVKIAESRVISFKEIYLILCGHEMNSHFTTHSASTWTALHGSAPSSRFSLTELLTLP